MGHNKGKDNVKKRAAKQKKNDRVVLAKKAAAGKLLATARACSRVDSGKGGGSSFMEKSVRLFLSLARSERGLCVEI